MEPTEESRSAWVRRGLLLNWITLAYNSAEAIVSIAAGLVAGSVALLGFGIDSVVEVTASGAAQWRLRADLLPERRARVERVTRRLIGIAFFALAAWISVDSTVTLLHREAPERSVLGVLILICSVIVMPLLARAKHDVAVGLSSGALRSEARQTSLCAYLSAIALGGVLLNALFGWWWADPIAALAMIPIIVKEGLAGLRVTEDCADCC